MRSFAPMSSVVEAYTPVLLVAEDGKHYLLQAQPGAAWFTHRGRLAWDDVIGRAFGCVVSTDQGQAFLVLRPTTADLIRHLKRTTQIVYPKDAAYLIMELDLWDGRRLIEAGTGSGGLTLAFARAVMPHGRVYSYENRPEHQHLARRNLEQLGLLPYVELKLRDIAEGFDECDVDAVFLDVREAGAFVPQAEAALAAGGLFGSLQPTVNQVGELVAALQAANFVDIRVEELLVRSWKPSAERLRPADRMIAHTGFLILARKADRRYRLWGADSRTRRRALAFGEADAVETPRISAAAETDADEEGQ